MINEYFANIFVTNDPIMVTITDDGWSTEGPKCHRTHVLEMLIAQVAPILAHVPAGTYRFNMITRRWFALDFEFVPVEIF